MYTKNTKNHQNMQV